MIQESTRKDATEACNPRASRGTGRIEHRLKCWPGFFAAILSGAKTHDLRRADDRDFRVGDILLLEEFDPRDGRYTGRKTRVTITYITSAESPCALSEEALNPDFCILSIALAP
jgi:Domain of unknown function (DUF3850)